MTEELHSFSSPHLLYGSSSDNTEKMKRKEEDPLKASNPIIFARTETTHIPKTLAATKNKEKLYDAVYSLSDDGSLKHSPMPLIEEETEKEIKQKKPSAFKFWFNAIIDLFCLCEDVGGMDENLMKSPLVASSDMPNTKEDEIPLGPLLKEQSEINRGKMTLVLDLDETLVHSTFQETSDSDYVIPVTIEENVYNVYVYLRPGALEFVQRMSKVFEVVVYTASLSIYADPLLDRMDTEHLISARLFRDQCILSDGVFVKDLGLLGRDLSKVIMIDNAATSFKFQPKNGIECTAFIDDRKDMELLNMIPFLEYLSQKEDVRPYTQLWNNEESRNSLVLLN